MNIDKALKHLEYKFRNTWKPTSSDIEAFNSILKYKEDKDNQQFNDNQLFAKLYITYYGELIKYFKGTVYDSIPQKALQDVLSAPIENVIKEFVTSVNIAEQSLQFEIDGKLLNPEQWTDEQKESIKLARPGLTEEEATTVLTSSINLELNK